MPSSSFNHATACPSCGLRYQCICSQSPVLDATTHIALLTHPNEIKRATNTGKLLASSLHNCQVHIWDRVHPPETLLIQIKQQPTYLLFPSDDVLEIDSIKMDTPTQQPLFIILDGTWQEAKKMLNKSPWLAALPKIKLHHSTDSNYSLRRNQEAGNLCTCEVGIALLQQLDSEYDFSSLQQYFELFLQVYEEDRNHKVWHK